MTLCNIPARGYGLCGDRDETINHIIIDCSKLAQKEFKTRHDWMGKVIYWELCKKLTFDHTIKWHMHKPELVLSTGTAKFSILNLYWKFSFFFLLIITGSDHLAGIRWS